jgi:hypothetical protein
MKPKPKPELKGQWHDYKGVRPSDATLVKWRRRAVELAKARGFHTACQLCKRPIAREHRFGRVGLRPGTAWRSKQKVRIICHSCYLVLSAMIEEMEILGARDNLPPEDYADVAPWKLRRLDGETKATTEPKKDEEN